MANDDRPSEEQEEREFLAGLKARTGRDLAQWMAAIAAQGYSDKNEIIDWLRTQGFPFARASWLERIHRNGGRPIYAAAPAVADPAPQASGQAKPTAPMPKPAPAPVPLRVVSSPAPPAAQSGPMPPASQPVESAVTAEHQGSASAAAAVSAPASGAESKPAGAKSPAKSKKAAKPPPLVEASSDPAALEKLVAAAKGYRPLYHHLEAQVRRAIPGVIVAAAERHVAFGAPREFAAVTLHPTEVRLGLALGDRPFDARLQQAKLRGPGPAITHMAILTDARQVNDDLLALVRAANARVNSPDASAPLPD